MGKKQKCLIMDAVLEAQLLVILRREGKTFTDFVHDMAREYIQHHGAGNPATPLNNWLDDPNYVACPTVLQAKNFDWSQFDSETRAKIKTIMRKELRSIEDLSPKPTPSETDPLATDDREEAERRARAILERFGQSTKKIEENLRRIMKRWDEGVRHKKEDE